MKHSEEKQTFETGAQRDAQKGKSRPDLISPVFLDRLGIVLAKGGEHYGERNWEQGMPLSRTLASAMRHLIQTIDGLEDEDHPAQCAWNMMAYIHTLHRIRAGSLPAELDDLPREKNLESGLTSDKKPPTLNRARQTGRCDMCGYAPDIKDGLCESCYYTTHRKCPERIRAHEITRLEPVCINCHRPIPQCQIDEPMVGFKCKCGVGL